MMYILRLWLAYMIYAIYGIYTTLERIIRLQAINTSNNNFVILLFDRLIKICEKLYEIQIEMQFT